ncbi:MAG: aminopeptidase [Candidatus Bathyarchaeia archaeon]
MLASLAAKNALRYVLDAREGDSIVILCDDEKAEIGKAFEKGAQALQLNTKLVLLETATDVFRKDIPQQIQKYFTTERPDIYVNIFRGTREETPFRIKIIHTETQDHKKRLGHCPGVTIDMLTDGALALTAKQHQRMQNFADALMERLKPATKIEIQNPAGTQLTLSVKDRPFFTDTRFDWKLMKWVNLPTGEVMVAPVEDSLNGRLVSDMAIGGIGPLQAPVEITAENGVAKKVTSANADVVKRILGTQKTDAMAKVVGEFAFGINPKAKFVEEFLECEKILGTIHIAFGDNTDFPGGKNDSTNHMDFMVSKPSVNATTSEGKVIPVLKDGVFQETRR